MKSVVLAHLFPQEMNIYGDSGNIVALRQRLLWRGFGAEVLPVEPGTQVDWDRIDLVFGGGGQDCGQLVVGQALGAMAGHLRALAEDDVPMLLVCGSYQLFGRSFTTADGHQIPGLAILGASTVAAADRMIGNIVVDTERYGRLVGFENHSGRTHLDPGQAPLGVVRQGFGNTPSGGHEGAVYRQVVGTYLHGPVLPKNPRLADELVLAAVRRRWGIDALEPLDDRLELAASATAERRRWSQLRDS